MPDFTHPIAASNAIDHDRAAPTEFLRLTAVRAMMIALVLAGLLAGLPALFGPVNAAEPAAPQAPAATTFRLTGFRSAQFGMTEDQVKKVIVKDFNVNQKDISRTENLAEKTEVLSIAVKDLMPSGGDAYITYIFGYQSHKLIQINVNWGAPIHANTPLESLVAAANSLRSYLISVGYRTDSMVVNANLPDGSILVFRGVDVDNRAAVLVLTGVPAPRTGDGDAAAKPPTPPPPTLQLSYISDPANPDIYKIKPGQF
ncbi:MAG: hypothetical protein GC191_06545 [Azospirillum sp.]|nr:hypothetical protein [Azospirillum sp.]